MGLIGSGLDKVDVFLVKNGVFWSKVCSFLLFECAVLLLSL